MDDGAGDLDVGVAPRADGWVFAEVFVADVVASDEGGATVCDDDLAVIAEVELEAVGVAFAGVEGTDVDPGVAEGLEVGGGEAVAADLVEEDVAADPGAGAFCEGGGEALAEGVVVDDVELDEDVVAGGGDVREDGVESGFAVDEEFGVIAAGGGEFG